MRAEGRPHAWMVKVRCGSDTYVKEDGSVGTAGKGPLISEEVAFTLATTQDQTLFQDGGEYIVRRLMPVECERLQGFPDGHTDLTGCDAGEVIELVPMPDDEKKRKQVERNVRKWCKECPDGPRYKACGNSMAVPCIRWLGDRIEMVDELVADLMLEGEL